MQEPRHRNQADVVLEPLSPVGHSHPLHPITRQHKPPASLGGCVFEDCSDLCRLCRVCVSLSLFLSLFLSLSCQEPQCPLDWQHFQVNFSAVSKKKKGDWLFQWPYSLCMCVFSPDLYMNILFVPWKPNEFAEVHLYSFDHGVFLIRTATCIVPKRIRSGFFLKRMSEAVGNESFMVPRSFCCDSCI